LGVIQQEFIKIIIFEKFLPFPKFPNFLKTFLVRQIAAQTYVLKNLKVLKNSKNSEIKQNF
jgi:hypothetical protein